MSSEQDSLMQGESSPRQTFGRLERLKSKKIITALFEKGSSVSEFPLKLVWITADDNASAFPAQAAFSVSKKRFAKAVDRNRIKRQMRESYRLLKPELYRFLNEKNMHIALMFIFIGPKKTSFQLMNEKLSALIRNLKEKL